MRQIEAHFGIDVETTLEELSKLHDSIFKKFDGDKSGTVDHNKFRWEVKKIMLAIAEGLGPFLIQWFLKVIIITFFRKL